MAAIMLSWIVGHWSEQPRIAAIPGNLCLPGNLGGLDQGGTAAHRVPDLQGDDRAFALKAGPTQGISGPLVFAYGLILAASTAASVVSLVMAFSRHGP